MQLQPFEKSFVYACGIVERRHHSLNFYSPLGEGGGGGGGGGRW
jgi:hypothetical protein